MSAGADPRDFDSGEQTLVHRASGSNFAIGKHGYNQFIVTHTVGDGDFVEHRLASWDQVLELLPEWVEEIERDTSMPDLWAELGNQQELVAFVSGPDVENAPFTDAERSEVLKQLDEIRQYAKTALRLSEQQMQQLDGRLRYLEEATERLGRKDWLTIAVGTIVTMAMEAIIPPSEVRNVFTMLLHPLSHLFGHPFRNFHPGSQPLSRPLANPSERRTSAPRPPVRPGTRHSSPPTIQSARR